MTVPAAIPEGLDVRRAATRTALLGIVFAVLVLFSYFLLRQNPGLGASDEELLAFYTSSDRRYVLIAGLYVMPFAGIAFLWFIVLLRMWISTAASRVDQLFSNAQLVSGIVFLALYLASAAVVSVLAATAEFTDYTIDPSTAREYTQLGWAITVVFAMRMAGVFVLTTSALGRRHGFPPRWFVVVSVWVRMPWVLIL